jgi:pimeloyl-ACP methyl ester carboxylesterase
MRFESSPWTSAATEILKKQVKPYDLALTMPTLIVGGRRDAYFDSEAVARLARSLPCARGVCLECNHEIPMERPHELAHLLEAFIGGLGVGCRTRSDQAAEPAMS